MSVSSYNKNLVLYQKISDEVEVLFQDNGSKEKLIEIKNSITQLVSFILENDFTLSSFLSILSHEYYTHTHSLNVCVYGICLSKELGLKENALEQIGLSALLHDIGKSKISDTILYKDSKLSNSEFKEVQRHSDYGWKILKQLGITNENILKGVRNHHEKIDGSGYPDSLQGNEIHLFARIIAVCDVFDALSTQKKHKDSYSTFDTLHYMKLNMKTHLDISLINQLILLLKKEV